MSARTSTKARRRAVSSGTATGGFDLAMHLTQLAINEGLGFLGGLSGLRKDELVTLPIAFTVPLLGAKALNVPYKAEIELERPRVVLTGGPNVQVECDLTDSSVLTPWRLHSSWPADADLVRLDEFELTGKVVFTAKLERGTLGTGLSFIARVSTASASLNLDPMQPTNNKVGNVIQTPTAAVTTTANLATVVGAALAPALVSLAKKIGDLPLTKAVSPNTDVPPLSLTDVLFAHNPGTIALGLVTGCGGTGDPTTIPTPSPATLGTHGVLEISTAWLTCLVADGLDRALGTTLRAGGGMWAGAITLPASSGMTVTLVSMTLTATAAPTGLSVAVAGTGTVAATCWATTFTFASTVTLTCGTSGAPAITVAPVTVTVAPFGVSAWCILLGIAIGFLLGAILGIVTSIVGAIIGGLVAAGLAPALGAIAGVVGGALTAINGLGPLQLPGPVGSIGLGLSACSIDDLTLTGVFLYDDLAARRSAGALSGAGGTLFDLDAGMTQSGTTIVPGVDLRWWSSQLITTNGARLVPLQRAFEHVTFSDLQGLTYNWGSLGAGQIPDRAVAGSTAHVAIGVRTDEGRYAKCKVWRTGATIGLEYVTYAQAPAAIGLLVERTITARTVVDSGEEQCVSMTVEASPPLSTFELDRGGPIIPSSGPIEAAFTEWAGTAGGPNPPWPGGSPPTPGLPTIAELLAQRKTRPGVIITKEVDSVSWTLEQVAQRIVLEAMPQSLVEPITYFWTAFGQQLSGTGTTTVGNLTVRHEDDSRYLVVESPIGAVTTGAVSVLAVDADGRNRTATVNLTFPGTVRSGGCRPQKINLDSFYATLRDFGTGPFAASFGSAPVGLRAALRSHL
jgi:hypothetical protein